MNAEMWRKPAVQRNVAQLVADGFTLVDPEEGYLSCGMVGPGRMASPEKIFEVIAAALETTALSIRLASIHCKSEAAVSANKIRRVPARPRLSRPKCQRRKLG